MKKGRKLSLLLAVVMVISILSAVQLPVQAITTLYEPLSTRSLSNPSSPYGYRTDPITGQQGTFHYGIDVPAAYGTPVRAVYGGNVVYASWKDSYGNIVIIYHEALGIYTFYCHLSSFNSSAGNTVNAGDTIAYVGSTGDSTGNHLHFGMCTWLENYWPRSYVNPTPGVNYNYTFDLSEVAGGSSGTTTIVLPSMSDGLTSKLVTPFTNSTLREQLDAVKEKYPSGSSTFNYSCDNGTGSWGFVSYVAYCLYGLVYPSTVTGTLPTSSWNATADSTVTLASSSEWSRVGYIHPTDLANSVAATVEAAAVGGYFYRNALPGDVLLLKMSNGYTYAALLEYIDAYGITIYTCNIPTYSPSYAVNSLEFTWNDFVEAFPGPIQIYRPSDARKYSYYNEPTHIVASDVGTFTLGNGNLNTEQEYFPDYNGILSTQFSIRDYTHPADEIVNLGNVSVGENETTTLTFYVANNNFIKNQYGYLTGLDARAELTLSSNAAQITRLDFTNSTSVSSLCSVTLTIKGLTASGASTVYIKNGYGNLAKITLTVEGTTVPVTGVSLDQSQIILNPDDTQTLTATVAPADATNKNVSWTSSDTSVATVSNGTVTAVAEGTATITVAAEEGNNTASCEVTVLPRSQIETVVSEVNGITLSHRLIGVAVGNTFSLTASLSPVGVNGDIQWSSSNNSIATVSNGTVSGVSAGMATITATCEGYSVSASVKVHNACSSSSPRKVIDVSYYQGNINWTAVKAAGYDAAMIRLGYTGYGSRMPTMDVKFTQYLEDALDAGMDLGIYYYSVAMNATEADREADYVIDTLAQYPGVFTYPIAYDFEWTNTAYDSNGVPYTQNTAYPAGGQTSLGKSAAAALINRFCGALEDEGYYTVIYTYKNFFDNYIDEDAISAIDHWVAQYSSTCTYTGAPYGMWQYTSTNSVNGISGNVDTNYCYYNYPSIIINNGLNGFDNSPISSGTASGNVSVTDVSLSETSMVIQAGSSATLTATVSPENATNKNVSWSSSNTSVAAVSNGVVTAVSEGTAIITVTTLDGGKTDTCTVTVTASASSDAPTTILPPMSDGLTSKLVTPFTNSTLREQLDAVKEEYPSGSSTFNYSCDNGTGSWGFVSYVAYCLYGLVYPSTVTGTLPTSSWNATADSTVTLESSSEWSRVGYIHPTDLANSVAATVEAAAVGGYFYRNALPGDVLLLKMSNGYTYAALLEYIDAYGITIYTCNIPTYSPSYAVNSLEFTWNDFVEAFPGPIQIYRPSDARKYYYYNEPTHIVATETGTFTLGNGNLNTEQEYFSDYNGILSTQFSTKGYEHPANEIVNLGNVSVGENETTTLTFYVANNNFIKNQYGYLTGLDARAELTLSSNAAQITRLDFTNSTSVSSLCSVTLTIKGLTASGASTVYIKNGYGNLAKITLTVEGTAVPVTGVSLDQSHIILNPDDTQTLTATVAPADATNKNVSWTSTGSAVYITPDGVVTAVSPGTAIITATTADGNKTASCTVTVLAVHTVGAEVHYNYSEGGSVSGGGSFSEGEQVTLSASENEGYVFDRWIDENGTFISADKEYTFTITEDVYLYAMYREVKDPVVTVDFLKSRGAVSGLAYLGKYETGSIVSLTAAPLSGYEFEGWFINGELVESGNTYTFTVFENVRIYAKFS